MTTLSHLLCSFLIKQYAVGFIVSVYGSIERKTNIKGEYIVI